MKSFLVKGFYLNFVKNVKCIVSYKTHKRGISISNIKSHKKIMTEVNYLILNLTLQAQQTCNCRKLAT